MFIPAINLKEEELKWKRWLIVVGEAPSNSPDRGEHHIVIFISKIVMIEVFSKSEDCEWDTPLLGERRGLQVILILIALISPYIETNIHVPSNITKGQ
jgi:hypothetical protein